VVEKFCLGLLIRARRFQFRRHRIRPLNQFLALGISEARFRVHQRVFARRHLLVIQFFADVFPSPHQPVRVIIRPVGKVHVLAAAIDVARDQP